MKQPLSEALRARPLLILDGAKGTELDRRGVPIGLPLWSANALITAPEVVKQIHLDYLEAGADIIVTNTFRTNRRAFQRAGIADRSEELTRLAVRLAHQARDHFPHKTILIAGSIAPVEDCYAPELVPPERELREEHAEMAARLADFGVDFILIETMTTIRESYTACAAAKATGLEVVVSFTCKQDGTLYGGEPLEEAIAALSELHPTACSLNCISPRYLTSLMRLLKSYLSRLPAPVPFAVYGNIGKPDVREGKLVKDIDEETYARFADEWRTLGAAIIGGCCGTTPEYIRAVTRRLHSA